MGKTKLLILSDAVTSPTGLGRITRELAIKIVEKMPDVFEVATAGIGGTYSKKLPFAQYPITKHTDWTIPELPAVWNDFAGDEKGVLLAIWNPGWLPWLADPSTMPPGNLRGFLATEPFRKWIYAPVDAEGPNGKMEASVMETLGGFNRVLAYTEWAARLIEYSQPEGGRRFKVDNLPHGTDTAVFYPRSKTEARAKFGGMAGLAGRIRDGVFLVGVLATNSARKDWCLAFQVCHELQKRGVNVGMWAHTDTFKKHWNLQGLADAYGLKGKVVFTNTHLSDEDLAWGIAACDVTLAPGRGEGWCLPASESLAMGVPVITGNYAACAEFVPKNFLVDPLGFHGEGFYCNMRPVFDPREWADKIQALPVNGGVSLLAPDLSWDGCWPDWQKWLQKGVSE